MKKIAEKYKDLLASDENQEKSSFRIYKERSYIGFKILNSLISKRNAEYAKRDKTYKGFYLNDRNKTVGLISQLYGSNGLFALINRFDVLKGVDMKDVKTDELISGIKSSLFDVLDYVEENGYDMAPYLDEKINNELFHGKNKQVNYIGAMTWALSLFVSTRTAIRHNSAVFKAKSAEDEERNKLWLDSLKERLNKQIKFIIEFFLNSVVDKRKDGHGSFGWGYANGCEEASLFFTYSVIEAYSDFEDNAIIDPDEELLAYLNRGITRQEDRLEVRYRNLCFAIGDVTWEVYKPYLRNYFFSERFDGIVNTVTREEILNTSRSSILFNSLYVIFIMMYSYMNSREQRYDIDAVRTEEECEDIIKTMTRALQLVQDFYNDLKDEGKESIVDRHIIAFSQHNSLIPDFDKILNEESIQASSLLPMLVKANNLVAYYILQFPQQAMTEMFDEVLEAKSADEWLWDKRRFDLLSTERYIEAIADYFDYYDNYEKNYAAKILKESTIRAEINARLEKKFQKDYVKELADQRESLQASVRNEIEQAIRSEYSIETKINERINNIFEQRANRLIDERLGVFLENISTYNRTESTERNKMELSEDEQKMKKLVESFMMSYLFEGDDIEDASLDYGEVSTDKIKRAVLEDLVKFRKEYLNFVARYCMQEGDKPTLSDVFRIIMQKDKADSNRR